MKVSELIDILKEMPQDAKVVVLGDFENPPTVIFLDEEYFVNIE